ncbi:SRPBCC family protein [Kiritimatiellaeota bacterium B1221]|nr:SRPBCC family protein [Kiritimatiellaeota bacterium B1221]
MKFKHSIIVHSDPATIFSVYQKVSEWPLWDPETESSSIDGDFVEGTVGKIKPKGAPASKMVLSEVSPDKSFTVACGLPLCKMYFIHELKKVDQGTEVINGVDFTGLLAPLFVRFIGREINETIPGALKGIKAYVEEKAI